MNGAQIILEMLILYEVKHVFWLPGENTLDLYDHWFEHPETEFIPRYNCPVCTKMDPLRQEK